MELTHDFGALDALVYGIPLPAGTLDLFGNYVVGRNRKWFLPKSTPWTIRLARESIALSGAIGGVKCGCIIFMEKAVEFRSTRKNAFPSPGVP